MIDIDAKVRKSLVARAPHRAPFADHLSLSGTSLVANGFLLV